MALAVAVGIAPWSRPAKRPARQRGRGTSGSCGRVDGARRQRRKNLLIAQREDTVPYSLDENNCEARSEHLFLRIESG